MRVSVLRECKVPHCKIASSMWANEHDMGAHIYCWLASKAKAIDDLRKTTDSADLRSMSQASAIVSTYLQPGLATEVCISESLQTSNISMAASERKQTNAVLIEAQHETMRIMVMGAFPRFVESAGFILRIIFQIQRFKQESRLNLMLSSPTHRGWATLQPPLRDFQWVSLQQQRRRNCVRIDYWLPL